MLILQLLACVLPGWVLLRRVRLSPLERLALSVVLSQLVVGLVFGLSVWVGSAAPGWILLGVGAALVTGRSAARLPPARILGGYGVLLLWGLALLAQVKSYAGAGWYGEWLQSYQRVLYFWQMPGALPLLSEPPLFPLLTAGLVPRGDFQAFQQLCTALGLTVWFPLCLLVARLHPTGRPRLLVLLGLLLASPFLAQNATYCWSRLPAAGAALTALALHVSGQRHRDPVRLGLALVAAATGCLEHALALPVLGFLVVHRLVRVEPYNLGGFRRACFGLVPVLVLLLPWYASKSYEVDPPAAVLSRLGGNLAGTLVPLWFTGKRADFMAAFAQQSPAGCVRDAAFLWSQTNLLGAMGLAAGIATILLGLKKGRFWWTFGIFVFSWGVLNLPRIDPFGQFQEFGQPVALLGLAFLATRLPALALHWRLLILGVCLVEFSLGTLLHFHLQAHDWSGTNPFAGSANANWVTRNHYHLAFFGDRPGIWASPLLALVGLLVVAVLWAAARVRRERHHETQASQRVPTPMEVARVALLILGLLLQIRLLWNESATYDEVAHLPAGYSYLQTGEIHLNPEHPPLVKELCALPLLSLDLTMPRTRAELAKDVPGSFVEWEFGATFLRQQGVARLLLLGRLSAVAIWGVMALVVLWWATELWGPIAGLISLYMVIFDPTLAAHGHLVTTDVGLAAFGTLFVFSALHYGKSRGWRWLAASGVSLGLALGTKFSAVVFLPLLVVLLGIASLGWVRQEAPRDGGLLARAPGVMLSSVMIVALAAGVVWAIYWFPRQPTFYLDGLKTVNANHIVGYPFYFHGQAKAGRLPYYLVAAALLKTPLPALLLVLGGALCFAGGWRGSRIQEAFLLVPPLVLLVIYSLGANNMGVRYLIPCMPFVAVATARVVPAAAGRRWAHLLIGALLFWQLVEFGRALPMPISYFNQLAGGTEKGYTWLDDSNVDWGGAFYELADYLKAHPVAQFRFSYLSSLQAETYGIHGAPAGDLQAPQPPGVLIASAHVLARAYAGLVARHGTGPGNWLAHTRPKTIIAHTYYLFEFP